MIFRLLPFVLGVATAVLAGGPARAQSCCEKAEARGTACITPCCVAMDAQNLACMKCNPEAIQLEPIFDGETLDGWVSYATGEAPTGWVVEDGALAWTEGAGDLRTVESYDHFELRLDWKIAPQGNSGIMYRVKAEDDQPFFSGPEYQILDDQGLGLDDTSREAAGALYALVAAEGKELRPAGEYNKARILVQGHHVEHWLNGKRVVEIEMHGPEWNELVAASKFAQWPQFAAASAGHIDLQDHGNQVWFRHITLRPLPPRKNAEGPTQMDVSTASAAALIQARAGKDLVVLDVRTPGEYEAGHLPGVENLDVQAEGFREKAAALDKNKAYLLYCHSGRRSANAMKILGELGFPEVYNMLGGYSAWSTEERPSE